MARPNTVWGLFVEALTPNRAKRHEEKIKALTKRIAREDAEAAYHSAMASFYSERKAGFDPLKSPEEAADFAAAFRAEVDQLEDAAVYVDRAAVTRAARAARIEAYNNPKQRTFGFLTKHSHTPPARNPPPPAEKSPSWPWEKQP